MSSNAMNNTVGEKSSNFYYCQLECIALMYVHILHTTHQLCNTSLQCSDTVDWATEGHPYCYKDGLSFVGADILTGALHVL